MAQYGVDEAYNILMSPQPYSQASGAAMMRNFGAAAQLMASYLRQGGATASSAGDAGRATQEQAQRHADWFDQVAQNTSHAANQLDKIASAGNGYQATAESVYTGYQDAVSRATGSGATPADEVHMIKVGSASSQTLSSQVNDWSADYSSFTLPAAPPAPAAAGSGPVPGGGGSYSGGGGAGGGTSPAHYSGGTGSAALQPGTGANPGGSLTGGPGHDRGPGVPGSVEVGTGGGEFAGWYQDPRTGYYVDPGSGREFDPTTNRWVDPVTGLPFGQVTQYATGLQGVGPAGTVGGLLSDTAGTAGASAAGLSGAAGGAGGFAGLFGAGNGVAVAAGYGGVVPPSLASGSAATPALWQQAGQNLALRQRVAENLIAREQAVRAGRPYLPPTQAGLGGAGASGGGRRPSYATAEADEAGLFSSRGREGWRSYLPPTQAGGADERARGRRRPDWLTDEDVFATDPAPSGVLGD
jgi:hypothetical protein